MVAKILYLYLHHQTAIGLFVKLQIMKRYILNSKSGEFLKKGGIFFYFSTGSIMSVQYDYNLKMFVVYWNLDIHYKTDNILSLVKEVRDTYCDKFGFSFSSKYTTIPRFI